MCSLRSTSSSLRARIIPTIAAAAVAASAGCSFIDDNDPLVMQREAVKVLAVNPVTGSLSFMGPGLERSMVLARDEINAAGGIFGRPLELILADSHSDPDAAVVEVQYQYQLHPDIVGIAGASLDAVSKRLLVDVAKNNFEYGDRIPMVSPASTSAEFVGLLDQYNLFFRTVCSSQLEGRILADKARAKGLKLGVVVGIRDINSREIFKNFQERFQQFGDGYDVAITYYDTSSVNDISRAFQSAFAGARLRFGMEPQFVLALAYGNDGKIALNEWARKYADTPLFLSDALMSDYFLAGLDPTTLAALENGVLNGVFPASSLGGGRGESIFSTAFCGQFPQFCRCETDSDGNCVEGQGLQPVIYAANAYDAVYTLALGLAEAAAIDPSYIDRGQGWNVDRINQGIIDATANTNPNAVLVYPGQWKEALEALGAGKDIDYEGASSSSLELDANGDPVNCDFSFWRVEGGRAAFRNSDGEKESVTISL